MESSKQFARMLSSYLIPGGGQSQVEKVLQEASSKEREMHLNSVPPDITPYLKKVPTRELRHIRKMSNLCGLTYYPLKVNPSSLMRRHKLELVTSSWICAAQPFEPKTAEEVSAMGDGMAINVNDVQELYAGWPSGWGRDDSYQDVPSAIQLNSLLPTAAVAAKLAEAAAAAAAAATGLLPKPTPAVQNSSSSPYMNSALVCRSLCPSEWFVCDDPQEELRIFAIQGSDSLDHWKLNLTCDPVVFEDPSMGVTVHRGVYEGAKALYDVFLPLIHEHLNSSPCAKIAFTGHSLGGSLATILMIMYKRRGVLQGNNISPVYTFGAPSVFCEGAHESQMGCVLEGHHKSRAQELASNSCRCTASGPSRLLLAVGLKDASVRNVMMHRDIVPRAFACDYSQLADILRGWGASFRSHCCLSGDGRKHLYSALGTMMVMQPDRHKFVCEPDHPLLPPGPGLYYFSESNSDSDPDAVQPIQSSSYSNTDLEISCPPGRVPPSARDAFLEFMDNPHPLETLAEPAAYLDKGSISRYHHPEHLTMALGRLIYLSQAQDQPTPSNALLEGMGSHQPA